MEVMMCWGAERLEMLRKAYRMGYDSGRADGLAEASGEPEMNQAPAGVISLSERRDAAIARKEHHA